MLDTSTPILEKSTEDLNNRAASQRIRSAAQQALGSHLCRRDTGGATQPANKSFRVVEA